MSTLKVDTIQKADGTGSLSVPAESGTVVTTASSSLGRRNLIINGAMQVAQRGTTGTSATSYHTVDRWQIVKSAGAVFDFEQSTDAPVGFNKSFKTTVTTSYSVGSTAYNFHRYNFEGQDISHLNWGTSDAKTVTLSFWVKSSITGTHGVLIGRQTVMMYAAAYTINTANTWEYKTITVEGPTSGTFATDNSRGFEIIYDMGVGSTFSATAGSWYGSASNVFGVNGAVKLCETNGATFQITGVQLEVGSVATPFEHRSYGEELALCQRYFYKWEHNGSAQYTYGQNNLTYIAGHITFPSIMRSSPTKTLENTPTYGNCSSLSTQQNQYGAEVTVTTSADAYGDCKFYVKDHILSFDAEL